MINMTKNILLINNAYPSPQRPNSGTYVQSIKGRLEEAGFHVDMLVLYSSGTKLKEKIKDYASFYLKLLSAPLRQYDVLYINHYTLMLPLFIRIPFQKNKIIFHWHGEELVHNTLFFKAIRSLMKKTLKKNDIHISPSFYYRSVITKQLDINPERIQISPSGGIDTSLFCPGESKWEKYSLHLGFPSALTKNKGVEYLYQLIQKVPELQKKLKKDIYIHYIDYGDEDNHWKKAFYKYPIQLIRHVPYPQYLMYKFYQELDICLMFSKRESLGLVVLEAMACNIPVIARNTTSMPELVRPGISGELISFSPDIDEILNKIEIISKNKDIYTPAEFVRENYSKSSVVYFYKQLLTNT